jgi:class 3 adenylate cyclase
MVQTFVRELMSAQQTIIHNNAGYIDKFIGDGVMAFWPVANSREDKSLQCERALAAAFGCVAAVGKHRSPSLGLRIGINLGEAIFGNFGSSDRWQYTLIGPEVDLAARLEQHRSPLDQGARGSIRVSLPFFERLSKSEQARFQSEDEMCAKNNQRIRYHLAIVPEGVDQ